MKQLFFFQGQQGEIGARGTAGALVTKHSQKYIMNNYKPVIFTYLYLHVLLQGEPGPDGTVGFPGIRGPQVQQDYNI